MLNPSFPNRLDRQQKKEKSWTFTMVES